jgi:hypothetical protein
MSWIHRISQWVQYKRHAKSRHGIHSPFIFDLIENGLRSKDAQQAGIILATSRHRKLVNKIVFWYPHAHILWLNNKEGEEETFISLKSDAQGKLWITTDRFRYDEPEKFPRPEIILFDLDDPEDMIRAWEKYKKDIHPELMIVVLSIHQTPHHTQAWNHFRNDSAVRLSLDLYKLGLVFFKEEFKEKQHFFLKNYM